MTIIELIVCANLVASLYLLWNIYHMQEELDELKSFSVEVMLDLIEELEETKYAKEKYKHLSRGHE